MQGTYTNALFDKVVFVSFQLFLQLFGLRRILSVCAIYPALIQCCLRFMRSRKSKSLLHHSVSFNIFALLCFCYGAFEAFDAQGDGMFADE
jgi:hypothetical protein